MMRMRYYVVADVHGFLDELKTALSEKGFFADTEPHKLIICGDLFDRGEKAAELQEFILELLAKDEVVLIRGNHEDLAMDLLKHWSRSSYFYSHHLSNGTVDTMSQLTDTSFVDLIYYPERVKNLFQKTPYIQQIIPAMHNYFETAHFIFVHGWIPCTKVQTTSCQTRYAYTDDWRNVDKKEWNKARWVNGMAAAHNGVVEKGKTIVCGHWHCSFGHSHYEGRGGELDNNPDFTPYYNTGIIALDACTAMSGKVNCIIVDD